MKLKNDTDSDSDSDSADSDTSDREEEFNTNQLPSPATPRSFRYVSERDRVWADSFVDKLKIDGNVLLNSDEEKVFKYVEDELANVKEKDWTSIDDDLFFPMEKSHKDSSSVGIGKSVGVVHASPERLLAW